MKSLFVMSLFLLLFIVSCNSPEISKSANTTSSNDLPEWTIFIYGHADHNLTPNMLKDYQEMISSNLNSKVKVIVAIDMDDSRLGTPFGTEVHEILGNGKSQLLEKRSEENFDDPAVLLNHMIKAYSKYPSKKRGLILWNHGASWDGGFGHDSQNSTVSNSSGLSIHQIKNTINSLASSLNLGSKPFEFISFDTCLMGNIESALEFKDLTKYYFASAELDFADGWDYRNQLNVFATNPTAGIVQLAPSLVTAWDNHHKNASEMDEKIRTQVALDLTQLDAFGLQMSMYLANYRNTSLDELAKAINRSNPGYGVSNEAKSLIETQKYRDVGQFLSLMSNSSDPQLANNSSYLLSLLQSNSIKASSLGDVRLGSQLGVSLEARTGSRWSSIRNNYFNLYWDGLTDWSSLLDDITNTTISDNNPPSLVTVASNMSNPTTLNKPKVTFTANNSDVDNFQSNLIFNSAGVDYSLGVIQFGFVENNETYVSEWDGKYYKIANNSQETVVSLGLQGSPGLNANGDILALGFKVQGILSNGVSSFDAYLIGYDSPFTSIAIQINGQTAVKKVSELAGAGFTFTPVLYTSILPYYTLGTSLSIPTGLTGFTVDVQSAPAGTYKIQSRLSDIWGNTSMDNKTVNVGSPF